MVGDRVYTTEETDEGICQAVEEPTPKAEWFPAGFRWAFLGWFEEDADEQFDFANTQITENITLIAKFSDALLISYKAPSGIIVHSESVEMGAKAVGYTLPNNLYPTDRYWLFDYWMDEVTENEFNFETADYDTLDHFVLKPQFSPGVQVSLLNVAAASGVTLTPPQTTLTARVGGTFGTLPTATRPGYTFHYWSSTSVPVPTSPNVFNPGTEFKADTPVPANMDSLWAVWSMDPEVWTVKFFIPDLTNPGGYDTYIDSGYKQEFDPYSVTAQRVDINAAGIPFIKDQHYEDYSDGVFNRWMWEIVSGSTGEFVWSAYNNQPVSQSFNLYADFFPGSFKVTYHPPTIAGYTHTGTVPVDDRNFAYGVLFQLLFNTGNLAVEDHVFIGWKLRDENGVAGGFTLYGNNIRTITGHMHYEAYFVHESQFQDVVYHANYDGATPATQSETVMVGDEHTVLGYNQTILPARPGYTFVGWSKSPELTGPPQQGEPLLLQGETFTITENAGTVNLYAMWLRDTDVTEIITTPSKPKPAQVETISTGTSPYTGDAGMKGMLLMLSTSVAGLTVLTVVKRKKKKSER